MARAEDMIRGYVESILKISSLLLAANSGVDFGAD